MKRLISFVRDFFAEDADAALADLRYERELIRKAIANFRQAEDAVEVKIHRAELRLIQGATK